MRRGKMSGENELDLSRDEQGVPTLGAEAPEAAANLTSWHSSSSLACAGGQSPASTLKDL